MKPPGSLLSRCLVLRGTNRKKGLIRARKRSSAWQEIRSWFAVAEPSSPLVPVLKYAEESIGKSFAELQKMYPPEVIAMLNQEKE